MKRSTREILFFILVFLLFFVVAKTGNDYVNKNINWNRNVAFITIGIIFTLIVIAFFSIAKLQCPEAEGFWDVSPFAKCKGTNYMWQGDSDEAKYCRELAETPEGRCGISSYNCPKGYNGQPNLPFQYTPISNDDWQNERCENKPACGCTDVGLCRMEAQV